MKTVLLPGRTTHTSETAKQPIPILKVLTGTSRLPPETLQADTLLRPETLTPGLIRRLVVLVPAGEIDGQALARRVWELAATDRLDVLYLALAPEVTLVSAQRRRLAELAAETSGPEVRAYLYVHDTSNWLDPLRQTLRPDDLLVCLADDRTYHALRRQAQGTWLAAKLGRPVYLLGNLPVKTTHAPQTWLNHSLVWVATIAVLAAFFWLQAWIERSLTGPTSTVLLCLSALVELYMIYKINIWME